MPNFKNRPLNRHIFTPKTTDLQGETLDIWATPEKIDVKNVFSPADTAQKAADTEGSLSIVNRNIVILIRYNSIAYEKAVLQSDAQFS